VKIGVIGNCQALLLINHINALSPGHDVTLVSMYRSSDEAALAALSDSLFGFDIILTQNLTDSSWGPLRTKTLSSKGLKLDIYPTVHFTGFQPDAVHVSTRLGLRTPFGPWQSSLVMAAFLRGLSRKRALALFNAYIYSQLGFFDEYAASVEYHGRVARNLGFEMNFNAWKEEGIFTSVPHHPKPWVMKDIALQCLAKCRIPVTDADAMPVDMMIGTPVWPVYTEICERIGVYDDMIFKGRWQKDAELQSFDLDEMISISYDAYDGRSLPSELSQISHAVQVIEAAVG